MEKSEEICKRIRIVKTILGLDQNQLAEKLGITQAAVSNYLTNRVPKWDVLVNLIQLARDHGEQGITLDWLIMGEKEKYPFMVNDGGPPKLTYRSGKDVDQILMALENSPRIRKMVHEFISRGKNKTLFEKLNHLTDTQIDAILNLIDQLNPR